MDFHLFFWMREIVESRSIFNFCSRLTCYFFNLNNLRENNDWFCNDKFQTKDGMLSKLVPVLQFVLHIFTVNYLLQLECMII